MVGNDGGFYNIELFIIKFYGMEGKWLAIKSHIYLKSL